ncbi:MAG: 7,8-didemethyl-8-hydroxy-5-deazariboflavin synthase subunit CofH [Candidatus Lokiarchaeota archaeon]|nr:7,8-didemethyl-8-hydroxy-5-deazariboflavin synthase subunit CofH [Candidatus Lokiarchaeota archaeon]
MSDTYSLDHIDPDIKKILRKTLNSEEIDKEEALKLLMVTGKEFFALQQVADQLRYEKKEDFVTFVVNRNINFTNVCYQSCKFCSFSVSAKDENAFLLSNDSIKIKVEEAKKADCSEVCIQGGINPELSFQYYIDLLKSVKEIDPKIHIHAFSPQEVWFMSKLYQSSIEDVLKELKKAGLDSMPGTAAEILVDKIRKEICPNKISTDQWIKIIKLAHGKNIPTTSTMMYGHIEGLKDRIEHLDILREIQKDTRGITEFVPLPFIKDNPFLSKQNKFTLQWNYGIDDLRLFCVARIFFNNYIDNIQCSWVKLGPKFAQISLNYGVNDFSGTLMEENISKSAGAEFGEYLSPQEIIEIIKSAGKKPVQRDTVYNNLNYY